MNSKNDVTIQDFHLSRDAKGNLWIAREGGEAMECSEETESALESLLEQFWEENF